MYQETSDLSLNSSLPESDNDMCLESNWEDMTDAESGNRSISPSPAGKVETRKMKKNKKSGSKRSKQQKMAKKVKGKKKKSSKKGKKKMSKAVKNRRQRNGKTIQQCVLLIINSFGGTTGCTQAQISKCFDHMNITVSKFILKKTLKKMLKKKVVAHPESQNSKNRYVATGKALSGKSINKKKRLTTRLQKKDQKFRAKMRRFAHLKNRGGRTYEVVVFEYLRIKNENGKRSKKTFNQIKAYLKANNMKCSNFVLIKVLERLRKKNCVKLAKWHNYVTGKEYPKPARNPFIKKEAK